MISKPSNISTPTAPLVPGQHLLVPLSCSCNSPNSSISISYIGGEGDEEENKVLYRSKQGSKRSKEMEVNLMADVSDCLDKYIVFGIEELREGLCIKVPLMEICMPLRRSGTPMRSSRSYKRYIMVLPTAKNGSMNYRSNLLHFAGCFVFGDIKGVVTANDIAVIFGISNEGRNLEYTYMVDRVIKTRIEASIRNIVAGRSIEERTDFSRLVSTQISRKLVGICENLDQIQTYNWAVAIAECLNKSLVHASKPHLVTGCVPSLLNKLPNFVRWSLFQLHKTLINMDLKTFEFITKNWKEMHCMMDLTLSS
ncbi:unnamed protein product [Malus baccata var. baccata]